VGGIVDFLRDRETGMFAEVRNPESVAKAVMELVRDPDLVSKIKRQSFDMVKEKYDWPIIAEEMKKIFENI
jgi:glycosyltransferase involved in cell wall biosynthesis